MGGAARVREECFNWKGSWGKSGEEERISTGRKQFGRLEETIMLNIQTKAVLAHLCMGTTILVACLPMYTGKALILLVNPTDRVAVTLQKGVCHRCVITTSGCLGI